MDLAVKDLGFALGFGREFGVPLDLASHALQTFLAPLNLWRRRVVVAGGEAFGWMRPARISGHPLSGGPERDRQGR